ncbi:MAG: hypothetical protein K0B81_04725 [Candidatus Cloacimonetes bacterium]|nr:hypothetical protein [Candidatus Cloacimonadota bacterium]
MKKTILLTWLFLITFATAGYAFLSADIESGIFIPGYNDVRIPGKGDATKFSLTEELDAGIGFYYRLNLHYRFKERHRFSLLYAPLTIEPEGELDRDISFQGEVFEAGEKLSAIYRFDSYRLQYRYYFRNQDRIIKGVGLTLKVRDAEISIQSEEQSATKLDTGVVPLINFHLGYTITPRITLDMDGEALFSPYGRAADVLLALIYEINRKSYVRVGYRVLEGGSDVDEVYTFALFNYLAVGLRINF